MNRGYYKCKVVREHSVMLIKTRNLHFINSKSKYATNQVSIGADEPTSNNSYTLKKADSFEYARALYFAKELKVVLLSQ